jgi:hypothetical protein
VPLTPAGGASFWQGSRGYVKKGVEKLLGWGEFPLYQKEWVKVAGKKMQLVTVQL